MKIIYLHQYFKTTNMSGGTRSYEMAKRLVRYGHEVYMITSWTEQTNQKDWFYQNIDGIHVYWYPNPYSNKMSFKRRILAFCRFAFAATRKILFLKSDIIFATSTPLTIVIPGIIASYIKKVPMVFEVRDLWPDVPIAMGILTKKYQIWFSKKMEKLAYNFSKHIIALSPTMKDVIISKGISENKISIISNSCDDYFFNVNELEYERFKNENSWLPNGKNLIYTGTLGLVNNVCDFVIPLARELLSNNIDVNIILVGDGLEYEKIYNQAAYFKVLNRKLFMKKMVSKKEIPLFLKYADMASSLALNIPEIQANSANKFFDALAAAKPILINYSGWQEDVIYKNRCGIAVYDKSPKEVANELVKFFQDESCYNNACRAAKILALNDFSRDRLAQKLEKILIDASR